MRLLKIVKSKNTSKKYDAYFDVDGKQKVVSFGASGYKDFILSGGDVEKRKLYLLRHGKEKKFWNDPLRPSTLARFILWEKPTLADAIKSFKERFNV